jgi:hypothetical protein
LSDAIASGVAGKKNAGDNDQVVQGARDRVREEIEKCSRRAAQKIAARLKSVPTKSSVELLAELIAREFDELNR